MTAAHCVMVPGRDDRCPLPTGDHSPWVPTVKQCPVGMPGVQ